jgi:hypothetical protein
MALTRLSSDVRSLLLTLAVALSLLIVAPGTARAGVNGCPHGTQSHFHGVNHHIYEFVTHKNIRVEGLGWVHQHTYMDYNWWNNTVLRKLC